jgi:DtxR family Mn-dependent transcriptional regulator
MANSLRRQTPELSESLQDYLETIFFLCSGQGPARCKDIGAALKVKIPSVNAAVKNLASRGLLLHERYGRILLTEKGRKTASEIAARHFLLKDFFTDILGLPAAAAERDACQAEHALSGDAIRRLRRLSDFLALRANAKFLSGLKKDLRRAAHAR